MDTSMIPEWVAQVVGGAVGPATLVAVGWGWLKAKGAKVDKACDRVDALRVWATDLRPNIEIALNQVDELHGWHDKTDSEGVKIWYSRNKGLELAIEKLAVATEAQTQMLIQLVHEIKEIRKEH